MQNIFLKIKKNLNAIYYIVFSVITLLYLRVIIVLRYNINIAEHGEFDKLINKNSVIWHEQSVEYMILHYEIWIGILMFFIILSCLFAIKKPGFAIFIQFIPYVLAFITDI